MTKAIRTKLSEFRSGNVRQQPPFRRGVFGGISNELQMSLTDTAIKAAKPAGVHAGPTYLSMRVEQQQIRIRFSNTGSGLLIRDKYGYGRGFEIAGADGKFHWARAQIDGQDIVVSSAAIEHPIAVRYAWSTESP
jgi:hypothetical protein